MFGKNAFAAMLCGLFLMVSAAPAQAWDYTWDWDCWCWVPNDSGEEEVDDGAIGITASNGAKYYQLEEVVPYTGVTHLVLVADDAFFPAETYAEYGDRILFVNVSSDDLVVEATDDQWKSNELDNKDGFLLLVQSGVTTDFRKDACRNCSSFSGKFRINSLPSQVDYWEDTLAVTELLPKHGVSTSVLDGLLSFVADLQVTKGLTDVVTGIL
ncbi:MAG: hypothetical protein ACU0DK_02050 [Pseudooceanicola sp.]